MQYLEKIHPYINHFYSIIERMSIIKLTKITAFESCNRISFLRIYTFNSLGFFQQFKNYFCITQLTSKIRFKIVNIILCLDEMHKYISIISFHFKKVKQNVKSFYIFFKCNKTNLLK